MNGWKSELAEPVQTRVPPPDMTPAHAQEVERYFSPGLTVASEPVRVNRLENAVFNEAGEFFLENGIAPDWFASKQAYAARDTPRFERKFQRAMTGVRRFEGCHSTPLWITDRYSHVYYHWLTHALARLEVAVQSGFEGPVLLPHWISQLPFVRQSLAAYRDVTPVFAGTGNWSLAAIDLVTRCSSPPDMHPVLVRDAASRLAVHFCGDRPARRPTRRIFVTRRLARNRQMVNEHEMQPVLQRHGFETVEMERLEPGEQVRLMQETAVLAGPHGAGLTNAVFMPPGGILLELRQLEGPPLSFMKLAGIFGHRYRYCVCENAEPGMHHHGADMRLDPGRLEEALAALPATAS